MKYIVDRVKLENYSVNKMPVCLIPYEEYEPASTNFKAESYVIFIANAVRLGLGFPKAHFKKAEELNKRLLKYALLG